MGIRLSIPETSCTLRTAADCLLVRTQPSHVVFTLPPQTLDQVRDAMSHGPSRSPHTIATINTLSTGTLQTVDNVIDQATATYRLKAMFANKNERCGLANSSMRVRCRSATDALVVPTLPSSADPKACRLGGASSQYGGAKPIEIGPTVGDPQSLHQAWPRASGS